MPLQRIRYEETGGRNWSDEVLDGSWAVADGSFLDFGTQIMQRSWQRKDSPCVLVRSLVRESVDFSRIREHALITMRRFHQAEIRSSSLLVAKVEDSFVAKILETLESRSTSDEGVLLEDYSGGNFDFGGFVAILPLPMVLTVISLFLMIFESFRAVNHLRHLRSTFAGDRDKKEVKGSIGALFECR